MRKNALCIAVILLFCTLTACSPNKEYEALVQENTDLKAVVSELTQQVSDVTSKLETEETVRARIVGGFTATLRSLHPSYVLDGTTLMFAVVTPYQGMPLIIRLSEQVLSKIKIGGTYHFILDKMSGGTLDVTKAQLEQRYAPVPSGYEYQDYIFDSATTSLGAEDSGVNGIQFFWEEVLE